jgi:tetratricopeptide (TPR) repeat protein
MSLEKAGLTRAAVACYHEAATLYQCFIESNENDSSLVRGAFAHVTGYTAPSSMTKNGPSAAKVLAFTCIKLGFLSHDSLGDAKAAARLYRYATLVDPEPNAIAFDGLGTCIEGSGGDLNEAIAAYRRALAIAPNDSMVLFHLAVALERLGQQPQESEEIMEYLRRSEAAISCLVDSWGYVR